ncbi:hypothetical protein [Geothrix sp. SG200]|uniref:hypothetical protein n=1 Tax=Geothrix sp. SG200 TaxID=2922865 RepID=UPI001FAB82D1|nr:hypothetical protein [Geothrix sp. SG200]
MREIFAPNVVPLAIPAPTTHLNGPMDLDLMAVEAEAMEAAGIPPELLLGYDRIDFGHPIPGGGTA